MAKKIASPAVANKSIKTPAAAAIPASQPVSTTAVRNSPLPKSSPAPTIKRDVTHQMIAERAYEISQSGMGGSPDENWYRAERELRGQS